MSVDTIAYVDETGRATTTHNMESSNDDSCGKKFDNETIVEKDWQLFSLSCGAGDCCSTDTKENTSDSVVGNAIDLQRREANNEAIDEWMEWWKQVL